jgi:fatty acid amide hydrolase 2
MCSSSQKGEDLLPPIRHEILLMSATEIAKRIRERKITSSDVVKIFIDRIKEVDPFINAVIDRRFDEAMREARLVDAIIESGMADFSAQPFLGVPFTGKDSIPVKGLVVTGGIYSRANEIASEDAPVTRLLKDSGAICVGITNVPETTFWYDSNNTIFGRTNNPYDLTRIPGGSSGGQAAILAAAGSVFGNGGDAAGSIRLPSYFCGIFGHKATPATIDRSMLYPPVGSYREKFLSFGPMCRYAADLVPMFKVMAGKEKIARYNLRLDLPVDLKSMKVFYMTETNDPMASPMDKELKESLVQVVKHFESIGCKVQRVTIPQLRHSLAIFLENMKSPDLPSQSETMTDFNGKVNLGSEILKACFSRSNHTSSCLLFVALQELILGKNQNERFVRMREELKQDLEEMLMDDGIFLYPTLNEAAIKHKTTVLKCSNPAIYTGIFSVLEMPVTQCPIGLNSQGLPKGLQIVTAPYQDRLSLAAAAEVERIFGGWVPPCHIDLRAKSGL